MKREVPGWFRLLLCWPALLVLGMGLLGLLTVIARPELLTRPETLIPGLVLLLLCVSAVRTLIRGARVLAGMVRGARHELARPAREAAAAEDLAARSAAGWAEACRLRTSLLRGQAPPGIAVWDVVAEPGEVFLYDVQADYERYYGQDVTYQRSSGFLVGSPAFVVAGMAVAAIGDASRRSAAEAQAAAQWRELQPVRLVISDRRLLCQAGGHWLSFWYAGMTAVYPEVAEWALVCQFPDVEPLRLRGVDAPIAAVITVLGTQGIDALRDHPSLRALGPVPPDA
ncbi:hypothetical protein GW571_13170 [Clavibacter capsici]|uniref:hypothetical protein n=1 Tax=Clavibacter capsici TaxID=1874630 RepID=UPI0014287900|nr:hypothetical protein [Clavibacter capsici]QIS43014.1 hypothetical protein GW571_13170 [Clavibacter capsici]